MKQGRHMWCPCQFDDATHDVHTKISIAFAEYSEYEVVHEIYVREA